MRHPQEELVSLVGEVSRPLRSAADLDPLLDLIGDSRLVLLGEASHGTSEFYAWRHAISARLIRERGFNFIAVEGDWPDCYEVHRYIHGRGDTGATARSVLHAFDRWPTWMWANEEVVALAEWLIRHNAEQPLDRKVGFFGLDVYSLWESMDAVIGYLDRVDPTAARSARRSYGCFDPYDQDVQEYAMATRLVPTSCEDETVAILAELRRKAPLYREDGREGYFNAEQNALVARNAERYYRAMVSGGAMSWNVRDEHMIETLDRLLKHYGPASKAIVWEHNTHIGDARATPMARAGMVNVGQLARDRWGDDGVTLVGFSSYEGTVIAGSEWGAPMEEMKVPPATEGTWEAILHQAGTSNRLILTGDLVSADPTAFSGSADEEGDADWLARRSSMVGPNALGTRARTSPALDARGHRAIGVVYDPRSEKYGNYVPSVLPDRYDALIHIDRSQAVRPLHMETRVDGDLPETYPFGI